MTSDEWTQEKGKNRFTAGTFAKYTPNKQFRRPYHIQNVIHEWNRYPLFSANHPAKGQALWECKYFRHTTDIIIAVIKLKF